MHHPVLSAASEASGWTPAVVTALVTSIFGGIIGILTLLHSFKNSGDIQTNAKKSEANQNEHKKQLEVVKEEFNGRVTEAIKVARDAAEEAVRAAFARGVLSEKESAGHTPSTAQPLDPEEMKKASRLLIREGNGPLIPHSEITEANFGPKP